MAEDEGTLDYEEVDSFEDDDEIILPDGAGDNETEDATPSNNNPSLNELYDILPKSLHGMVEPVLSKWQSGVDREFEKMSGYRQLAEAGVSPDIIEASLELAQQISANPRAIYDELAERYGWQQAQQIMQEATAVANTAMEEENDPFAFDMGDDPTSAEIQALKAELDAMKNGMAQEAAAAQEAQYEYEIETSLDYLREQYGDFDENMIIRRAMLLSEDYPDAELPQLIGAAYEQYQGEVEQIRSQVKRAPRVSGGAGNSLPAPEQVKLNSRDERIAAIEQIAKQYGRFN
jgi:hypothetical protein